MNAFFNPLRERLQGLRSLWAARQPRERSFLMALAAFVALALLLQGLWSAHSARVRLHNQIPQLRLQVATLQRQAGEIRQLQSLPASPAAQEGNALLTAAIAAARTTGLVLAANQLQLEGPRQLRLRANLPFDQWLEWIAALQRDAHLRLILCRIEGADEAAPGGMPGVVKIDALFALPEPS
ncbi:MAG: type II secretion system protein M [Betaproteobacteria bacterium]|nr:type II secretion system protein M [Betaproteobacteria bacterium]